MAFLLFTLFIAMLFFPPSPAKGQPPKPTRISPDIIPYNYPEKLTLEGLYFDKTSSIVLIGSAPKTIKQKSAIDPNKNSSNITDIHIQDKYAYVIEDSTTLHILDVEKPDDPHLVGTLFDPNFKEIKQVWAAEGFLYLMDSGYGIWIADISDPNDPQVKGEVYFKDIFPVKIFVKQNFIYSLFSEEKLPDDPNTPSSYIFIFKRYENIFDLSVSNVIKIPGYVYDICVKEYEVCNTGERCESAYVATGEKVRIYDVTNHPSIPPSEISQIVPNGASNIQRILISGNTLYMGDHYYGIHIADISNITVPQIVSSLRLQGEIKGICPCGAYVLIANGPSGLQIIDLHERETPSIFGNIYTFGDAHTICSYGYYIYVANGDAGLGIVEAPSLMHSNLLAYKNTKDNIWAITSQNGYAYVSNGGSGVKVFKTIPSWDPNPASEILNDPNDKPNKDHSFTYTFVDGDMLYLADKTELEVWEWDPLNILPPKFRGGYTKLQDSIMSIFVQGNFAYIANLTFGFQSLNIANPGEIGEVGYIYSNGFAYDITVDSDKLAYLANGSYGLWIVDFQNPYQPVEKFELDFDQNAYAHSLEKYDDHIYMTNGAYGIEIINVSNPDAPYLIDTIDYTEFLKEQGIKAPFNDFLNEIDIEYPFLYTAGDYQGIWINYIYYIPGLPPKVTPIDFISLPYGASAVDSDGERLYIGDDFKNFYVFYPPMYSPKDIYIYPLLSKEGQVTFRLNRDLPAGSYDIFVISDSGVGRLEKAINVYQNKVAFYPGLNILSYPGPIPFENSQAFYLLKNLNSQEKDSSLKINNMREKKMESVSGSFQVSYINQENQPAGDNFDILPLGGYLLYFQGTQKKEYFLASNILNMTNPELLKRLKSEIVRGQNIISMPLVNESMIKSSDLIFSESQPTAISIQEWNVTHGKWQSGYNFFNTVNGNVKNLSGGHGYLVSVP